MRVGGMKSRRGLELEDEVIGRRDFGKEVMKKPRGLNLRDGWIKMENLIVRWDLVFHSVWDRGVVLVKIWR
jgi:hypothetical protein